MLQKHSASTITFWMVWCEQCLLGIRKKWGTYNLIKQTHWIWRRPFQKNPRWKRMRFSTSPRWKNVGNFQMFQRFPPVENSQPRYVPVHHWEAVNMAKGGLIAPGSGGRLRRGVAENGGKCSEWFTCWEVELPGTKNLQHMRSYKMSLFPQF